MADLEDHNRAGPTRSYGAQIIVGGLTEGDLSPSVQRRLGLLQRACIFLEWFDRHPDERLSDYVSIRGGLSEFIRELKE